MTLLKKVCILMIINFILLIYLLLVGKYMLSLIIVIPLVIIYIYWINLVGEEIVIINLYEHGYEMEYEHIIQLFSEKGRKAVNRLIAKNIVRIVDTRIQLIVDDYKCSMAKYHIRKRT